jgi:hypothetical protein
MNKLKRIYEIGFKLKKSVLCSTMLKVVHQKFISIIQWDRKFKFRNFDNLF